MDGPVYATWMELSTVRTTADNQQSKIKWYSCFVWIPYLGTDGHNCLWGEHYRVHLTNVRVSVETTKVRVTVESFEVRVTVKPIKLRVTVKSIKERDTIKSTKVRVNKNFFWDAMTQLRPVTQSPLNRLSRIIFVKIFFLSKSEKVLEVIIWAWSCLIACDWFCGHLGLDGGGAERAGEKVREGTHVQEMSLEI